jgi:pilus assembly protein CpaD
MSSNRSARVTRALLVLCLAATAAACASTDADKLADRKPPPLTPTEQFAITVTPGQDQILLAPHADGLSTAQTAALQGLAERWRDNGDGVIRVQTPTHGGEEAYRSASLIQDALTGLGVRPDQVQLADYDAGPRPHAPIVVGFTRYDAKGPDCAHRWNNLTRSMDNRPSENFGCATTANIAAMIANPADLIAPRPSDPADAARRGYVLSKYRQGQVTSTAKDDQASGTISSVGH